jgi:hypothetical protein
MKAPVRFLCLLLCILIALSLVSCGLSYPEPTDAPTEPAPTEAPRGFTDEDDYTYHKLDSSAYKASPYYEAIACTYSYDTLGADQQRLYDELLRSAYTVAEKPDLDAEYWGTYPCKQVILEGVRLSDAEMVAAVRALYDDHPEIFWLWDNCFDYVADRVEDYLAVRIYSTFSSLDLESWIARLHDASDEFIASVPEGLGAYERERFVHDYLIDSCEYIETDASNLQFYHCVYGNLVRKKAVCEGYARTMQMLLNLLGVECVSITGESVEDDSESPDDEEEDRYALHMWNAVKLDDSWYNVDPTWDDDETDDEIYNRYLYFNVDDTVFGYDHRPSPLITTLTEEQITGDETYGGVATNLFIPVCTDMTYNYYVHDCPHLTSYDNASAIEDGICQTVTSGESWFVFYVDPTFATAEDAYTALFDDYPQYFFDYIDSANARLDGIYIDENVLCGYDADLSFIFVKLTY